MNNIYDCVVIGGGPAGLAASSKTKELGLSTLLIEREDKLGGILKQCIHDGFGLSRYNERLTGPEYAYKDIEVVNKLGVDVLTSTFVLDLTKDKDIFTVTVTNSKGISKYKSRSIVLATGCRERTSKQVLIHGTRPAGIFTAGTAQSLINNYGLMPSNNTVILGSGDIGLIMARRITLEGGHVIGVYEVKDKPSGLSRNISQCLNDFSIPLHLSTTVTRVFGDDRLTAVEIAKVDKNLEPIKGTEEIIKCDSLILSVGLIPENEVASKLNIEMCPYTKGSYVDNSLMSLTDGVFAVGNCLSVNDLVDYVSENGFIAAQGVYTYLKNKHERNLVAVNKDNSLLSVVPQYIDKNSSLESVTFYIRSKDDHKLSTLIIEDDKKVLLKKTYQSIITAESIRVNVNLSDIEGSIKVRIE